MQILAIIRNGVIIFPKGDDIMQENDEVYFCISCEHIKPVMAIFGYENIKNHNTLIIGGGPVAKQLAKEIRLHHKYVSTTLIEKDEGNARILANELKNTKIIHGDGNDIDILKEVNIAEFDSVIGLTENDEKNILIPLFAKQKGAELAIALINNPNYDSLAKSIGIDSVISPMSIIASKVLEQVRDKKIKSVYSIQNNFGEILEAQATSGAKIIGKKIKDLDLPLSCRIGAIVKSKQNKKQVIIAKAETKIAVGDTVILITSLENVNEIEEMFN
jgi:trk system potassium uptake protein TrkA